MKDEMKTRMKRRNRRRSRQGGFSLVELMVGLTVFVVSLMALIQIAVVTNQARRASEERQAAWNAISEQLRLVERDLFANLLTNHDGRTFSVFLEDNVNAALRPVPGDPDGQTGLIQITAPAPLSDPTLLLEVTAQVDWVGSAAPQSLTRTIRISKPGANL